MTTAIERLRNQAISHSLCGPASLEEVFARLKFVQADPIRSPARAQDLILRQRVDNYRAGDLERHYPALGLEEDFLYAYGFMTREAWELLRPPPTAAACDLSSLERKVLETVNACGELHPRKLDAAEFGRERVINAWGGYSLATKRVLEHLHHRGLLRVTRRENGIRVYGVVSSPDLQQISVTERFGKLILVIANILAPVTERCLLESLGYLRRMLPQPQPPAKNVIAGLIKTGELQAQTVDGIKYLYPPPPSGVLNQDEMPRRVRFLAPFDPLVWDRRRFEHFWGWQYRFEAYTPQARRIRGYYAMPLMWGDDIIGWANVNVQKGILNVELGYVAEKPPDSDFHMELEKEINRLEIFLNLKNDQVC